MRAARQVLHERRDVVTNLPYAIVLTSTDGRVLLRATDNSSFSSTLDEIGVLPGWSVAEDAVGTASLAILQETGRSVIVRGPEHFSAQAQQMSSAAIHVRHPVTQRKLGCVSVVCSFVDSSPLMLLWAQEFASDVASCLLDMSTERERALFATYIRSTKNGRQSVVCIDDKTVVGNAKSTQLMSQIDQQSLWDLAATVRKSSETVRRSFDLEGQGQVRAECAPIETNSGLHAGVIIRFDRIVDATMPAPATLVKEAEIPAVERSLSGMVGHTHAWRRFCADADAAMARPSPILVVGEPGTGKTTAIEALCPHDRHSLCHTAEECYEALSDDNCRFLLIEDVMWIDQKHLRSILARAQHQNVKVLATYRTDVGARAATMLHDVTTHFSVAALPALRDRRDDLPELLQALTTAECGRAGPTWLPETVSLLNRLPWTHNVAELRFVVADVLRNRRDRIDVRVCDLPADIQLHRNMRKLSRLEESEAIAIITAMRDADGNKKLAAEFLGVARSTLYRKARALGLDTSNFNF
ncbi:hypothetical protein BCM27_17655 [Gordonia terrae]|nr:hypothetical protein BCM27_17655 [Gordonia terrae]